MIQKGRHDPHSFLAGQVAVEEKEARAGRVDDLSWAPEVLNDYYGEAQTTAFVGVHWLSYSRLAFGKYRGDTRRIVREVAVLR